MCMQFLSFTTISASISGFESPTAPYMERSINLDELLIPNPSSTFIHPAPNGLFKQGIAKRDWLIVNASLQPFPTDVVLACVDGQYGISTFQYLTDAQRIHGYGEIELAGVVQQSVHFFRKPLELHDDVRLTDASIHQLLVEKEHSTILAKSSGESMMPYIQTGDLMLLERHLNYQDGDVAVIALNGDLVVKRLDLTQGRYTSDNPAFKSVPFSREDRATVESVIHKTIRVFRCITP
jgi:SOS-response transcriptional repressor LexA